jgi:hypothetical protein
MHSNILARIGVSAAAIRGLGHPRGLGLRMSRKWKTYLESNSCQVNLLRHRLNVLLSVREHHEDKTTTVSAAMLLIESRMRRAVSLVSVEAPRLQ